jgi:hypothetical protein
MNTIIILKSAKGSYDDYEENIEYIFSISRKDFNVMHEYSSYLLEILPEDIKEKLMVHRDEKGNIYSMWLNWNKVKRPSDLHTRYEKFKEQHSVMDFLITKFKAKRLNSFTEYIFKQIP